MFYCLKYYSIKSKLIILKEKKIRPDVIESVLFNSRSDDYFLTFNKIKDLNIADDFLNSKELYINNFIQNISNQDYESILNYTIKIYLILIELNYLKNEDIIQSYASFFINFISKINSPLNRINI